MKYTRTSFLNSSSTPLTRKLPVYIDCTHQNGRYDEHGVARHGYAVDALFIDSPRDVRYHYTKRFGIEARYRLSEQSIATTSTQNPVVRLLYVVVSLLLQNAWRYLHWEYIATPRHNDSEKSRAKEETQTPQTCRDDVRRDPRCPRPAVHGRRFGDGPPVGRLC